MRNHGSVWLVVAAAVAANLTILLFISMHFPAYLQDYSLNTNPDAQHYVRLGENVWQRGVYSRQETPPYAIDSHRTPVYPLIAGAVQAATGVIWPLYVLQALVQLLTALLVYDLGCRVWGNGAGLAAALLYVCDPLGILLNWQAMSECLFVFTSTLTVYLAVRAWQARESAHAVSSYASVGVAAGLAALTRPTALYLAVVLAAVTAGRALLTRRRVAALAGALCILLVTCVTVLPWVVRNHLRFGVARLTTIDSVALVYEAATSVYELKYDVAEPGAVDRLVREFNLPTMSQAFNPWLLSEDVATIDARQRSAARTVLTRDPMLFAQAAVIGLLKTMFGHITPDLAMMAHLDWRAPGFDVLAAGDIGGFANTLGTNHWILTAAFLGQNALAVGIVGLAAVGLGLVFRRGASAEERYLMLSLAAIVAYHAAAVSLLGLHGEARYRAPMVPVLCLAAGYAVDAVRAKLADVARELRGRRIVASAKREVTELT